MSRQRSVLDRRYLFEYDVGQWTYGTIQVLKDRETGNLRTCKTVHKAGLKDPRYLLERLQGLEELQHPHVSGVVDVLEDQSCVYIVTDHCNGGDVADWLERFDESHWVEEQTAAAYIRQTLLAFAHSHAAQVFHRDIRPSCLGLTSRLPDATVKVADFGLAAILDPDNSIAQRSPSCYTAPEVLTSYETVSNGAADLWSLGAVAYSILLGTPPYKELRGRSAAELAVKMRNPPRFHDDDGWAERSEASRDFVRSLLRPAAERPTAARALHHPWLKGLMLGGPQWTLGMQLKHTEAAAQDIRMKSLCYVLAVLLIPLSVPYRDFEQLRVAFVQVDSDHDGFVPQAAIARLLLGRCPLNEAVQHAVNIADVGKTDVLDLCATAVADLIAREFFAAGPTSAPLAGPFSATDLAPRMLRRFFEVFGDRGQPAVTAAGVRSRVRTATARDIEVHAGVRYDEIIGSLPEDRLVDGQALTAEIGAAAGRGTPLGAQCDAFERVGARSSSFGLNMLNIFHACGGTGRSASPHSIRIF